MADSDPRADFRRKAQSPGNVGNGVFAFAAVGGGGGVEFGVGTGGADGHRTKVMDAINANGLGINHGVDPGDEFGTQVVAELHVVEAQLENFFNQGFAGMVAAGIPAGAQGQRHHFST